MSGFTWARYLCGATDGYEHFLPDWSKDFVNKDESTIYPEWYQAMAEFFPLMEEVLDENLGE